MFDQSRNEGDAFRDGSVMAIWSWRLSDRPSLQDLLEVQKHFGLPSPALVEKDWHVVKALAAIVAVDAAPFRLVFSGGTALCSQLARRRSLRGSRRRRNAVDPIYKMGWGVRLLHKAVDCLALESL